MPFDFEPWLQDAKVLHRELPVFMACIEHYGGVFKPDGEPQCDVAKLDAAGARTFGCAVASGLAELEVAPGEVARATKKPIMDGHTCSRDWLPQSRGLSDRSLRAIAGTGGIVGIDHVGLGGDVNGIGLESRPLGMDHLGQLPNLTAELMRRKWKLEHLRKFLSENWCRMFAECLPH